MLELAGGAEHAVDRGDSADRGRDRQAIEAFVGDGNVRSAGEIAIRGDNALARRVSLRGGKVDRIDFGKIRFVAVLCGDRETLIALGFDGDETVLAVGLHNAEVRDSKVDRSLRDRNRIRVTE